MLVNTSQEVCHKKKAWCQCFSASSPRRASLFGGKRKIPTTNSETSELDRGQKASSRGEWWCHAVVNWRAPQTLSCSFSSSPNHMCGTTILSNAAPLRPLTSLPPHLFSSVFCLVSPLLPHSSVLLSFPRSLPPSVLLFPSSLSSLLSPGPLHPSPHSFLPPSPSFLPLHPSSLLIPLLFLRFLL